MDISRSLSLPAFNNVILFSYGSGSRVNLAMLAQACRRDMPRSVPYSFGRCRNRDKIHRSSSDIL